MAFFRKYFPKNRGHVDYWMLCLIIMMLAFGMLMMLSASYYYGIANRNGDGYYYVKQQLRGIVAGGVIMYALSRLDYRQLNKKGPLTLIYGAAVVMLIMCLLPGMNVVVRDAQRWIRIFGFQFQPSEYAKFALLFMLAGVISRFPAGRINNFRRGLLPLLLLTGLIAALLVLQPNYSILAITVMTAALMVFYAGLNWKNIAVVGLPVLALGVIGMLGAGYRRARVLYFLKPFESENLANTYQLRQSLFAIGSGGVFGVGLSNSKQKLLFLPFGESDFIFSIIAEEGGFIGCIILLAAFMILFWRGFRVAWNCPDRFGSLVAAGFTTLLAIQTLVCIGVATGVMPTTGVPLPFISFGSSSLLCTMAACGVLLSVSRATPEPVPARTEPLRARAAVR